MRIKANIKGAVIVCIFISSIHYCVLASAQTQDENAVQRTGEEKRQLLNEDAVSLLKTQKAPEKAMDFIFDYGGWATFTNTHYKNLDNNNNVEDWIKKDFYLDMRAWVNAMYYQLVGFYGRIQDYYVWRPSVSSDYNGIGDDNNGPLIDSLYVNLDLIHKFKIPLSVKVGRQYITIGRSIVYSNIHDGIQVDCNIGKYILLKGFVSKTKEYEDNIDYSVPGYNKKGDNRHFYGLEAGVVDRHISVYGYVLVQRDLSHEYPENLTQNYTYNSEYVGVGVRGEPSESLSYWAECIKEYGTSNTDATRVELAVKDVDAWAFDVGAKYRFNSYSHPVLDGEIAYGSGDKNRINVTNTVKGNTNGKDTNFLYFGIYEGGYALYPRLSNLFIYRAGLSLKPFEFIPHIGDNFAVGTRFYIYSKDQKSGGISDLEATKNDADVGEEIDFFAHWKAYENLYFTLRFGKFFPGAAFPKGNRASTEYLYLRARFII